MPPVRLATQVYAPGSRRRALVLHGLGSDGPTTWRLADALATAGHEVVVPDLRGHGRSPTTSSMAIADHVEDVALLGHGWDLVVGHSLGGAVLAALCTRDGFARTAVLLDPALRIPPEGREPLRAALVAEVGGGLTVADLAAQEPGWDDQDVQRKVLASALVTRSTVEAHLRDNDPWDVGVTGDRLRARTHLVAADPDRGALLGPEEVAALTTADHVTATTLAGAGHSVHRDDPDAVLAVLREALGPS